MADNWITVKVEGLKELHHALMELPKELHRGPLRAAVSAGAKVVQDQARANVRSSPSMRTGTLERAIYRTRSRSNSNATQEAQIVGVRSGKKQQARAKTKGVGMTLNRDAWYWTFLEFGTSKMAAEPFMRPAFITTVDKQIEAIRVRLADAIEKAAAKLAVK